VFPELGVSKVAIAEAMKRSRNQLYLILGELHKPQPPESGERAGKIPPAMATPSWLRTVASPAQAASQRHTQGFIPEEAGRGSSYSNAESERLFPVEERASRVP
jgi:hypothetical protein